MNHIPTHCIVCNQILTKERLEALEILEKNYDFYTCISCEPNRKIKGVWSGETGTSNLILADSVGEEGIRFSDSEIIDIETETEQEDEEETVV